MSGREKLAEFIAGCQRHITGDEKDQAQIFLDRLFQAFVQPGSLPGHPVNGLRPGVAGIFELSKLLPAGECPDLGKSDQWFSFNGKSFQKNYGAGRKKS
jgi:hypothetical protein